MFLQKCAEYSGLTVTGVNNVSELYKSVVCFMINSLSRKTFRAL